MLENSLSLCMIGRNCANYLDRCLSSCFSLFDEIIYVDNQSTDNSVAIAKKYNAVVDYYNNITPGSENWSHIDDFSLARNKSFSLATSKWIMWLDTDDIIKPIVLQKLFALKEELTTSKYNSYVFRYNYGHDSYGNPISDHLRHRLVRNSKNNRWEYPIHEVLVCKEENFSTREDIFIDHERLHGYAGERNYTILKLAYEGRYKNDGRIVHYYARECNYLERYDDVIAIYSKRLYDVPEYTRLGAYYYYTVALKNKGKYTEAIKIALEAYKKDSRFAEFPVLLSEIYDRLKDPKSALYYLEKALSLNKPKDTWEVFMDDNCYIKEVIRENINIIKSKLGSSVTPYCRPDSVTDIDSSKLNIIKQGRNELCSCGSGRKYKKCCGNSALDPKETCFILPLHNADSSREWLPKFLDSYTKTEASKRGTLLIMCNGDSNWYDEVYSIAHKFPLDNIDFIACDSNLGFIGAVNKGVLYINRNIDQCKYIGFLNSDVTFSVGWLDALKDKITTPGIGAVGFCSRSYSIKNIRTVGWLEFSCVLFKKRAIVYTENSITDATGNVTDIQVLDPIYGMGYFDDDDLCLRLLLNGWKLDVVDRLLVVHHHRGSTPDFVKKISEKYPIFISKWDNIANNIDPTMSYVITEYLYEQKQFFKAHCEWVITGEMR